MGTAGDSLIDALLRADAYPHAVRDLTLIETHISWVLLTGDYVYKLKKPVKLPFLDFSTLDRRRHFCAEELRLNRRLAPEIYLDVVTIGGSREAPRIGAEPAIEYAVKMKQFAADATLDRQLGGVDSEAIRRLGEAIAAFHEKTPPSETGGDGQAIARNLSELEQALGGSQVATLGGIAAWLRAALARLAIDLRTRHKGGAVKEGHGDLHLENLACIDGRIVPFDALEFDPALRCIDVLDEVAFTAMDFMAHGRDDFAFEFLNSYLECTGDYGGLAVLRLYLVHRALVRAKVQSIKAAQASDTSRSQAQAERYMALAERLIAPPSPLLIITHGLSGSGKTRISSELVSRLAAIRVRSDLERKRLRGLDALAHSDSPLGGGLYDSQTSDATYAALGQAAAAGLRRGFNVIADGTFLRRRRRDALLQVANQQGGQCVIVDCQAPEAVLRERIVNRAAQRADASEATTRVLDHQLTHRDPLAADELSRTVSVDTTALIDYGGLASQIERFRAAKTKE